MKNVEKVLFKRASGNTLVFFPPIARADVIGK